jgi:hypothetical protein
MNLEPVVLHHGEVYGKLTVLGKVEKSMRGGQLYRCGCECGYKNVVARAGQLLKGKVKSCLKCSSPD